MAGFRLEEGTPSLQPMRRSSDGKGALDEAERERQPTRERRRHPASHLRLASSRK
jgi:hypothetical protein